MRWKIWSRTKIPSVDEPVGKFARGSPVLSMERRATPAEADVPASDLKGPAGVTLASSPKELLALQRLIGNQAVLQLLASKETKTGDAGRATPKAVRKRTR